MFETSLPSTEFRFRTMRRTAIRTTTAPLVALVVAVWLLLVGSPQATLAEPPSPAASTAPHFSLPELSRVPKVFPVEGITAEGVQSLFFEGPAYQGRPTRVFAWVGLPAVPANQKVPAMVLIHGGGGSAFERWVKVWTARGYAAIAMDTCGCIPEGTYGNWKRHEHGGPPGWDASFGQLETPIKDQWTYHAVSAAVLAHSLLRSYPEVDADRIGVTGISWGGYLTSIVAGVDSRFQFACPVYGCGFLGENSVWVPQFERLGTEKSKLWLGQWDPSVYLPHAAMPMLWVNGTNDFAYPMDSWKKSYLLPKPAHTLCLRIRMPHGHGPAGENPEEIHRFANQILRGEPALPHITEQGVSKQGDTGTEAWLTFESKIPVVKAELAYTRDRGPWQDRKWESLPATIDQETRRVRAAVPADATVFYLNLFDNRDCVVSSEHIER